MTGRVIQPEQTTYHLKRDIMNKTVGMIGVGLMGHGIASNIVKKGWALHFQNHPGNQPTADLLAQGARAYDDPGTLARSSDIMLLCVTGSPQVEEILNGAAGILTELTPGKIVIDCSTAIPSSTVKLAAAAEARGVHFLDSAMTRTPKEAAEGRLNLLIGGDHALFEEIKPLLQTFAENLFYAGPVGSGHKLKLLHNYVSLGSIILLSEAAVCAKQGDIAMDVLIDLLRKGGGYGAALDRISPFLLEGDDSKVRFSLRNALKDIRYYTTMAEGEGCPRDTALGVKTTLEKLNEAGLGDAYLSTTPEQIGKL
jgi:3-hydroxyisobutyrate dehydrogenase-like beta-hydroxyacid dehydrogenase